MDMLVDIRVSLKRFRGTATIALMRFMLDNRASRLGIAWVILAPLSFIAILSYIYSHVNGLPFDEYLLYLTVGLVTWNLIYSFVADAPAIFVRNRPYLLQGELSVIDIVLQQMVRTCVVFMIQFTLVILALLVKFEAPDWTMLSVAPACFALLLNGTCLVLIFGIIGARFRDGGQLAPAAMRIVFLATPILWVADAFSSRSALLLLYIQFNPFYHYIEIVRRPLVTQEIAVASWVVVIAITAVLACLASVVYKRYSRIVTLWL